ncbi:hypothetical protein L226DRAFT_615623 [Lentinus tigrinus ALCF2SS1-7]|uniref:Uncharacterized protein n=1 Tax=Lentinus tigrinus ALCF2SS1-6 TaxID=1328759 RepID=A0A5C2RX05_9APHY|nr:hypothetical protein L227DRAFT_309715 [Lentinus tigrinus ALCF2SS1-6]RPD71351.1 hypothetical protein L226DRAFT_615623 [Lentinus tigrinus ALCF2SS1-7]
MFSETQDSQRRTRPSAFLSILPVTIAVFLSVFASLARAADPFVLSLSNNAPAQCDTFDISWSGGTPNYTIAISSQLTPFLTRGNLSFNNLTNPPITWTADRCGGVPIYISGWDSGGQETNITFTLGLSANMSCLSDEDRSSNACLAEDTSLHLPTPSATAPSRPNSALQEVRSLSILPLVAALVGAGVALCSA